MNEHYFGDTEHLINDPEGQKVYNYQKFRVYSDEIPMSDWEPIQGSMERLYIRWPRKKGE